MNDRLLEILSERSDFTITGADKKMLDFFVEYLDHGSLFLVGYEPGEDPAFNFTNDAQRYRFAMSEIRAHVLSMKKGIAFDWDNVPFEYIQRPETT